MIDATELLILQAVCLTVSTLAAAFLGLSRIYMKRTSSGYEVCRWLLVVVMLLLSVHFYLQMHFGFRAQGEDVGAVINILFYSPATYVISYSILRMVSGRMYLKRYIWASCISYLLIVLTFLVGYFLYGSLHMKHAFYTMGALFFLMTFLTIIFPAREITRLRQEVENETGSDISNYNMFLRAGTVILWVVCGMVPLAIFSNNTISLLAPFFLFAITFYTVSFIALGFSMAPVAEILETKTIEEPLTEEADSDVAEDKQAAAVPHLTDEQVRSIEAVIEEWRNARGYSMQSLNSTTMARRLNIPKRLLIQYLSEQKGKTFRVWLSDIRIEEVKRMLIDKEEYNNETIAIECGFSSRSWLQERFKAATGMTPSEWKKAQKK